MEKNKIFAAILILLIIPLFYFGYQVYLGELQFKTVLSGSMSPAINTGDVVLISKTNPEEIKEGDIITFREGKTFTTHRVVEIVNNSFRTKGDANEDPDAKIIKAEHIVGKVVLVIPFLGYLSYFVRTPLGFLIFILIPGILIIYSEIKKIRAETRAKPKYEVSKIEKGEIISKIRKEFSSYSRNIRISLCIYFICAFLLIFLVSPYYTGAFFSDIELSTNNLFKAANCFGNNNCGEEFSVSLNSPENNTLTNNALPDFNFTVSGNREFYSCELFIDDVRYGINDSVQNNTPTILQANSSLSEGNHIWFVNCTNSSVTNQSETRNIIIDTINPKIFYNPSTTKEGNQTEKWIFINVTASDLNKDTVILYWNGTEETFDNYYGDIYWENKTGLSDGNYTFYVWINDTAGNTNRTEERKVKIYTESSNNDIGSGSKENSGGRTGGDNNNNIENTITFSINLTFPENNSCTNKNTTEFNFTVSGTEQNYTCELFLKNQTGNWINYGANNSVQNNTITTIIPNQSFENLSEGIYNWVINCTANQTTNSSETRVLTIDRTAPIVNLLNSSFSTNEAQPKIYFNFIDDLSDKASCVLYFNNSEVGNNSSATENTTTFIIPNSAQNDGNYTVYVNCTDLAGNTNKSLEINVSIDATPITTATGIKEDGTNYTFGEWTNSSYINITLNCSATDCNTTLYCTDANNSCEPNLTGTQIQISAEGITYLRFRSNDTEGNNESVKNKTIKIDRTKPLIQINSPISNSTFNSNLIEINLTVTEDNLNYTNISVYNSTGDLINSTTDNRTGNYIINLSVPDGIYNITAISFDLAGNKNSTTIENITVDATPPEISDWNINNTSVPVNSSVKLNATITDFVGVDIVKFFIEPFGNLTVNKNGDEYFIICNSTNPCNTMQAGVYNWTKIWANDTLGNYVSANISLQFNITN